MGKIEIKKVFSVSEGKIVRSKIIDSGKAIEVYIEQDLMQISASNISKKEFEEMFPVVEASKLSLNDSFMEHKPQTEEQKRLKKSLEKIIKEGIKDFRRPIMDPSIDEDGNITFKEGNKPAVGKNCYWWEEKLKACMPEKNSRQGTLKEYDAFLGTLIKYLVEEEKWLVEYAWKSVCDDSKKLGHYPHSENAKDTFEPTGSRPVGKWHDLANTFKIVGDSETGFSLCGGCYNYWSNVCPLADVCTDDAPNDNHNDSVGWLVVTL